MYVDVEVCVLACVCVEGFFVLSVLPMRTPDVAVDSCGFKKKFPAWLWCRRSTVPIAHPVHGHQLLATALLADSTLCAGRGVRRAKPTTGTRTVL